MYVFISYCLCTNTSCRSDRPDETEGETWSHGGIYSVETTYGINSVISKQMTLVENAETGQFLFLMVLILSCFICS
jgi:hypothetical protein